SSAIPGAAEGIAERQRNRWERVRFRPFSRAFSALESRSRRSERPGGCGTGGEKPPESHTVVRDCGSAGRVPSPVQEGNGAVPAGRRRRGTARPPSGGIVRRVAEGVVPAGRWEGVLRRPRMRYPSLNWAESDARREDAGSAYASDRQQGLKQLVNRTTGSAEGRAEPPAARQDERGAGRTVAAAFDGQPAAPGRTCSPPPTAGAAGTCTATPSSGPSPGRAPSPCSAPTANAAG